MEKPAGWFENHKNAVLAEQARVHEVAFNNLEAEIARRDEEKQSLIDHISELVIKNAQLLQENNRLKDQLPIFQPEVVPSNEKNGSSSKTQEGAIAEKDKPVPYEDYANLTSRLEELRTRNVTTEETLESAIDENERLREKVKLWDHKFHKLKDSCKEWQAYGAKMKRMYAELKASPSQKSSLPILAPANGATVILNPSVTTSPPTAPSDWTSSPIPHLPSNAEDRLCPLDELPQVTLLKEESQQPNIPTLPHSTDDRPSASKTETIQSPLTVPDAAQANLANTSKDGSSAKRTHELHQYISAHWREVKGRDLKGAKEIVRRSDPEMGRRLVLDRLPLESLEELYTHVWDVVRRRTLDLPFNTSSAGEHTESEKESIQDSSTIFEEIQHGGSLETSKDPGIGIMDFAFDTSSVAGPLAPEKLPSSQTTQDDAATEEGMVVIQPIDQADDDDLPVFVSAKSLKRKRRGPDTVEVFNDNQIRKGGSATPIPVKDELHSSPLALLRSPRRLDRTETLDLDELGFRIATPRKRILHPPLNPGATKGSIRLLALQKLRHERSTSEPAVKDEPRGDYQPYVRLFETTAALTYLDNVETTAEDRANSAPAEFQQLEPATTTSRVLNTLDPNTKVLTESSEQEPLRKRRRKAIEQAARNTPTSKRKVADDGRERLGVTDQLRRYVGRDGTPARQSAIRPLMQNPTPPTTGKSRSTRDKLVAQATPTTRSALSHLSKSPASRPGSRASNIALRSRPVEQLTLDHFKPNPAYNQGLDYAFVETVRGRDARKCLPGCTNPECCGSAFRALAMAAPTLAAPRGLFDVDDEADDETRLLQDYMGDAYDVARISRMPTDEKEELLLQARTRLLADRHGRHKQAYERRSTPPGFWRTDFPTTQETEKDREEARKLDRAKVEERWRDAMRDGGRWIFRDE
ncbi:SAE2-domain-containing protein [Mytilinidion resinicola]|uniref:SAE2-domain-containing protein n=1 Tax=Mytilinidion resinicola TaxID=574789 RepID=A0A6A6YSY9_9PEZI|nr:SAE2-domain-containing protein [Mytilinidion resinicola]KAF2811678.1 SAE2-domain-containing protein [Mytilinidion resinicola]